jgi:hypothetical protein
LWREKISLFIAENGPWNSDIRIKKKWIFLKKIASYRFPFFFSHCHEKGAESAQTAWEPTIRHRPRRGDM